MRYLIIGAGAIGCTFAAYLARANKEVTLIARGENLRAINAEGIQIRSLTEDDFVQPVPAVAEDEYQGHADVVFVCVKAYALDSIIPLLNRVTGPGTIIIPVLNALKVGERISRAMSHEVIAADGVAYVAVKQTAPGEVLKKLDFFRLVFGTGAGESPLPLLESIRSDLIDAGIDAEISHDMLQSTLRKFMRVSTLSAAEVYFDTDAGGVRSDPEAWEFLKSLGSDIARLAEAAGVPLDAGAVDQMLSDVSTVNADYLTSLMYDVRNGNPAEFDTQFFDVFDLGVSHGAEMPAYARISAKLGHQPAIDQLTRAGQPA